jgi:hypothetical protein
VEDFHARFVLEREAEGFFVAVYLARRREPGVHGTSVEEARYREEICALSYAFFA